ncbi:hypothetical protein EON65_31835 [archaeon]|nr:MAG: hypothetical protein EON65_31835 [archaeon]
MSTLYFCITTGGDAPPVWAVAFSTSELKELSQHAIAHYNAPYATLIHREPEGDIDPDEPWYVESHWLIEEGEGGVRKVGGIKVLVKCTQDKLPTTYIVRFKVRGSVFELKDTETIAPAGDAWVTLDKALPTPPTPILPPSDHLLPATIADVLPNEVTGDCALEGRFHDGGVAETRNFEDYSDHLCQSLTSPPITLTNPTDTRIAITEFNVEFLSPTGDWVKGSSAALGTQYTSYHGRQEVQFGDAKSFEVEPHSSVEVLFQGIYQVAKEGRPSYNGRPHNQRIHTAFPNPLHARVNLTDDKGTTKVISFSHANAPLEDIWTTYDEAVQVSDKGEGFGPDYQADIWLCVENPLDLNKNIICVTTHKTDAHEWFVRMHGDRRNMDVGSYQSFDLAFLRKLAFKNSLKPVGERLEEIDLNLSSSQYCKLYALVDLETNWIYALHAVIHVEHEGKTIARQEAYVTLDVSRVTPKKE